MPFYGHANSSNDHANDQMDIDTAANLVDSTPIAEAGIQLLQERLWAGRTRAGRTRVDEVDDAEELRDSGDGTDTSSDSEDSDAEQSELYTAISAWDRLREGLIHRGIVRNHRTPLIPVPCSVLLI